MVALTISLLSLAGAGGVAWGDTPEGEPRVRFTDVTTQAGIDFIQTIGDGDMTNIVESAGVGCAFLDYNGDGWMDVYLVSGCWVEGLSDAELEENERKRLAAATDRLYRNKGDGTFEDVTVRSGLAKPAYGMGVIAADYDGDGDTDLYITNYGPNQLYRNNGDGTFTDVAATAGVADAGFGVGAVFFDYNGDGRLDLFVGNYLVYDPDYTLYYAPDGFPGPLSYTGQQDRLFRAKRDGTFSDVTHQAGIEIKPTGRAMGIAALDYDMDGRFDLFVSNDAMENFLLRNKGDGTFENQAWGAGVAFGENGDATAAMGVQVVDYDGDGFFDLFVPDMTFTCLYHHNADKKAAGFEDRAAGSGIAAVMGQYVAWGSVLADFDLDGWIDLYVSNGDVHHLEPHEDVIFVGDGRGGFIDVSESAGEWMTRKYVGRGTAGADFDNDGDVDVLVTNLNDRPALLRNDTPRRNRHWLGIELVGRAPNRDAIGAIVRVEVGGRTLVKQRLSGGSYLSQHDPRLHFGLGERARVERVEVIWPDGSRQTLRRVPADRYTVITQQSKRETKSFQRDERP